MLAKELISDTVPSVKTSDHASRVLNWMSEFKVGQLPVVNHEQLLGLITEDDLIESDIDDLPIGDIRLSLPETTSVFEDAHFFEALKVAHLMKLDILPVLDARDNSYVGAITYHDFLQHAAEVFGVSEPGGIIVLSIEPNSYSISEIGRICESNDAKILSLNLEEGKNGMLLVTIKLNVRELSRVIATFQRFDYEIAHVVFDTEQLDDYRESYENLLRYLNP